MFEYELIQQRNAELQRLARHDRLVREALATQGASRPGMLTRLARSVRPSRGTHVAEPRVARLGEC